jgi:hypothetical protein
VVSMVMSSGLSTTQLLPLWDVTDARVVSMLNNGILGAARLYLLTQRNALFSFDAAALFSRLLKKDESWKRQISSPHTVARLA